MARTERGVNLVEVDGSPDVDVESIVLPNGSLTDNGDGTASIEFPSSLTVENQGTSIGTADTINVEGPSAEASIIGSTAKFAFASYFGAAEVVVDPDGEAFTGKVYLNITDAVSYVSSQSPSASNPWLIKVKPGVYTDEPLTIPDYTKLIGDGHINVFSASPIVWDLAQTNWATNGGAAITLGTASVISGMQIQYINPSGTIASDAEMVKYSPGSGAGSFDIAGLQEVYLIFQGRCPSIDFYGVYGNTNLGQLQFINTAFVLFEFSGTPTFFACVYSDGGLNSSVAGCSFANTNYGFYMGSSHTRQNKLINCFWVEPSFGVAQEDVYVHASGSGEAEMQNCYYNFSSGNIVHVDRTIPNNAYATISPGSTGQVASIIKAISGQTADFWQLRTTGGSVLTRFNSTGALEPASMTNTAAQNNSIFYSTTNSKLVYKDSSGTVHNLY